jgi:exonuclease III
VYRPRRVRLLVVYRPPAYSATVFMTEFQAVLEILSTLPEKVIIVGDFNIHVDVLSDKLAVTFLELIETFEQEEEND